MKRSDEVASSSHQEATAIIAKIAEMYRLKAEYSDMDQNELVRKRQQYAKPIIEDFFKRIQ